MGQTKLADLVEAGKARADGELAVIQRLLSYQVDFDPRFQMVPGAGNVADASPKPSPFAS